MEDSCSLTSAYNNQSSMVLAQRKIDIDQWSRIESLEMNSHTYSQLTCNKEEVTTLNSGDGKLDSCI